MSNIFLTMGLKYADFSEACWMLLSNQILQLGNEMGGGDNGCGWTWVARGNSQLGYATVICNSSVKSLKPKVNQLIVK